ncbi:MULTISPECIES: hypothetical protein [unclassified Paenibacillus]|uniref:hypothetical protein n=1 Tax=unclassified Paenibacillus TaxID=185978 RepID=UPI001C1125A4|nr:MULTISPECIES: hypothetical protein [unclassified Paenibacillus]MBU5444541.1 hypothetical protein [Paenibacillus sp. MSJ-34]CAH0120850.1 hypothetical protein PAE9249_03374 [Paenibacillus sp. CECT 9249]
MIDYSVLDPVCRCSIRQAETGGKQKEYQALSSFRSFADWLAVSVMRQAVSDTTTGVMSNAIPHSAIDAALYPSPYIGQSFGALASPLAFSAAGGSSLLNGPLLLSSFMRGPKLSNYAMPLEMNRLLGYSNFNRYM